MESADTIQKVCAAVDLQYWEFENEQDMLITNCLRNTTFRIVDNSVCNPIDYDYKN